MLPRGFVRRAATAVAKLDGRLSGSHKRSISALARSETIRSASAVQVQQKFADLHPSNGVQIRGFRHSTIKFQAPVSDETVKIMKACLPVLEEHGYTITRTMYKNMFAACPHVKEMFNQAHQHEINGEQAHQPKTLACAVYDYAANIDNLGALADVVEKIVQKHVSLAVRPEHYGIVGEHLLGAIKEVLGDAATPEILAAFGEAYTALAEIFIAREKEVAEQKANQPGGWLGHREFVIDRKVLESKEIASFYLVPKDGGDVPHFLPGQYTSVKLEVPGLGLTQRNYTLSSGPGKGYFRLTIKREPAAEAGAPQGMVSNYFHDGLKEGDVIEMGVPCGDFYLDVKDDKPIVLIGAGVGLTPVVSILEHIVNENIPNKVYGIFAARDAEVEAMHDFVSQTAKQHLNINCSFVYDTPPAAYYPKGPLMIEHVKQMAPGPDCQFYFCGPKVFMYNMLAGLHGWGVPKEQQHFEFFGPWDPPK